MTGLLIALVVIGSLHLLVSMAIAGHLGRLVRMAEGRRS